MSRWIVRPSPALTVACLALLVALGGTSVAAVSQLVPRNSVGTAQLRDSAVTTVKVRNNAITTPRCETVRFSLRLRSGSDPGRTCGASRASGQQPDRQDRAGPAGPFPSVAQGRRFVVFNWADSGGGRRPR